MQDDAFGPGVCVVTLRARVQRSGRDAKSKSVSILPVGIQLAVCRSYSTEVREENSLFLPSIISSTLFAAVCWNQLECCISTAVFCSHCISVKRRRV